MYSLLTDELTDISIMQQLFMFVKCHSINTGEPETTLHTATHFYTLLIYFQNWREQALMENRYLKA